MSIITQKVEDSRVKELDQNNLKFGKVYSDHMLVADFEDGKWGKAEIVPYGNLSLSPATTFMHYGQAIFEGIKAYRNKNGEIKIFRPLDNWKRFNQSANRMAMPDVPEDIFINGMRELIALDRDWVPELEGCSLYIRPFMIATDEFIGVRPAESFKFIIITSPAGAYYNQPIKVLIQNKYVRACKGGVGFAKAAGNYGSSMLPMIEARQNGFEQILWTDAEQHKYVQEIGTMNVFFVFKDKVVTPDLTEGTILDGVTRKSIIQLLKDAGNTIEERPLSVDEIIDAHKKGELLEVFGAGTAAVVAPIAGLHYNGLDINLPEITENSFTEKIKKELADIRYGNLPDRHNWMFKVC